MSTRISRARAAACALSALVSAARPAAPAPAPQDPGTAPPVVRAVRFAIDPPGAQLAIDGRIVPWFGRTIPLAPGAHTVAVDVGASRCCQPLSTTILVAPPRGTGPQTIALRLAKRPAQVVLVDAPADALLACPGLGFAAAAGRLVDVAMTRVQWSGRCDLARAGEPPRARSVTLHAGEVNAVRW